MGKAISHAAYTLAKALAQELLESGTFTRLEGPLKFASINSPLAPTGTDCVLAASS